MSTQIKQGDSHRTISVKYGSARACVSELAWGDITLDELVICGHSVAGYIAVRFNEKPEVAGRSYGQGLAIGPALQDPATGHWVSPYLVVGELAQLARLIVADYLAMSVLAISNAVNAGVNYEGVAWAASHIQRNDRHAAVLIHLAGKADETGRVQILYRDLAADLHLTREVVVKIVKRFISERVISVEKAGPRKPNIYTIHIGRDRQEPSKFKVIDGGKS